MNTSPPSVSGHLKGGDAIEAPMDLLQLRDSWRNMHHLTRRKQQSRFRRHTQTPDSKHAATDRPFPPFQIRKP